MTRWLTGAKHSYFRINAKMTPKEFEKQIARILRALEERKVEVKWNDRFPDPDNPSQIRQVDISIRDGHHLTIAECRLHSRAQDVKWIEELYGRKISLNADAIIGVSSSGYTKGAVEKARRLGVFLRHLSELSDVEIANWGRRTKARIAYVKFNHVRICIIADDLLAVRSQASNSLRSLGHEDPVKSALNNSAIKLCNIGAPEGPFTMQIFFSHTFLGTFQVSEAVLQASWNWVFEDVLLPTVLEFKNSIEADGQPVVVEKNEFSRSEVHHRPNGAFALIDVSTAAPEDCCFLRDVKIIPGAGVAITSLGVLGIGESSVGSCSYQLAFSNRTSAEYLAFLSEAS